MALVLAVAGIFWTGRESAHGVHALWEHWWCALPLAGIAVGIGLVLFLRRPRPAN